MTSSTPRRPRVVVADDHPDMVTAISRLLSIDCDVVGTVTDGSRVVETVQRLQPDVAILDLNLPGISGFEACRQITRANPTVKVIVFTAMPDPSLGQRATDAGASAFLCKMATDCDLLATVLSLAERQPGSDGS
ncbi:MAG TPA: response regulator transcription factor [Vicinamibacterales bacterium]|nr:response regulator transcription factor [Vicinamibacterales bacterium]